MCLVWFGEGLAGGGDVKGHLFLQTHWDQEAQLLRDDRSDGSAHCAAGGVTDGYPGCAGAVVEDVGALDVDIALGHLAQGREPVQLWGRLAIHQYQIHHALDIPGGLDLGRHGAPRDERPLVDGLAGELFVDVGVRASRSQHDDALVHLFANDIEGRNTFGDQALGLGDGEYDFCFHWVYSSNLS